MKGSAHYDGRAVDVFVRPVSAPNKRNGWAIASYLVAHASRLDVDHVIFDKRIWSAGGRSEEGWRDYDPGDRAGDRAVLEHRDHVHVDVVARRLTHAGEPSYGGRHPLVGRGERDPDVLAAGGP